MTTTLNTIKQPVDVPPALSREDLATILGVHIRTISQTIQRLNIQPLRKIGKANAYSPEVVSVLRRALAERSRIYQALVRVGAQPTAA